MKYSVILILSLFCLTLHSQSPQTLEDPDIHITASTNGVSVKLRWAVFDFDLWNIANEEGYSIMRRKISENGIPLTLAQQVASQEILESQLTPVPEAQWEYQFPANEYADVAKHLLYSSDFEVEITDVPRLADAIEKTNKEENKLTFSLLLANNDFDIARAMALGYEDTTALADVIYQYRIIINTEESMELAQGASFQIGLENTPDLPAIPQPTSLGQDKLAILSWDCRGLEHYYTGYFIERSEDGVHFETCNKQAIIWTGQEGYENNQMHYRDSLENNDTEYMYRIRGATSFNELGPPSDIVVVEGVDPPLDLALNITASIFENQVNISWVELDHTFDAQLHHFDIYRALEVFGHYGKINMQALSSDVREFTDYTPIQSAYYRLYVQDINGHEYESVPVFVQGLDTVPPSIPEDLNGFITEKGKLVLDWKKNSEEDLLGYKILSSNSPDGNYIQLTNSEILNAHFEYSLDPEIPLDSLYVKVIAVDLRKNYSLASQTLALERPVITPPSKPNLYQAAPTPEGVLLRWNLSESNDLVKHELQRKLKSAPGWKTLLSIEAESSVNEFLDNQTERREYRYRLVAIDDRQNQSSSAIIDVFPYDNGIHGEIEDLRITAYKYVENGKPYFTSKLNWKYPLDHMLQDFQIYRSKKGSDIRLYKTVPLDKTLNEGPGVASAIIDAPVLKKEEYWKWSEGGIVQRGRYIYQVIARYKDGSTSSLSRPVMVKL